MKKGLFIFLILLIITVTTFIAMKLLKDSEVKNNEKQTTTPVVKSKEEKVKPENLKINNEYFENLSLKDIHYYPYYGNIEYYFDNAQLKTKYADEYQFYFNVKINDQLLKIQPKGYGGAAFKYADSFYEIYDKYTRIIGGYDINTFEQEIKKVKSIKINIFLATKNNFEKQINNDQWIEIYNPDLIRFVHTKTNYEDSNNNSGVVELQVHRMYGIDFDLSPTEKKLKTELEQRLASLETQNAKNYNDSIMVEIRDIKRILDKS